MPKSDTGAFRSVSIGAALTAVNVILIIGFLYTCLPSSLGSILVLDSLMNHLDLKESSISFKSAPSASNSSGSLILCRLKISVSDESQLQVKALVLRKLCIINYSAQELAAEAPGSTTIKTAPAGTKQDNRAVAEKR